MSYFWIFHRERDQRRTLFIHSFIQTFWCKERERNSIWPSIHLFIFSLSLEDCLPLLFFVESGTHAHILFFRPRTAFIRNRQCSILVLFSLHFFLIIKLSHIARIHLLTIPRFSLVILSVWMFPITLCGGKVWFSYSPFEGLL